MIILIPLLRHSTTSSTVIFYIDGATGYANYEVKYYVINSFEDFKELCKNYKSITQEDVNIFVDFSTQTVLGFVFLTFASNKTGCDDVVKEIGFIKGIGNTIFVGGPYGATPPNFGCFAEIPPPYYDAIVTQMKITPSHTIVVKMSSKDFCPYSP